MLHAPLIEAESIQEHPSIPPPTKSMLPTDIPASVLELEADLTSSLIGNYYYILFDSKSYAVVLYT